MEITYGDIVRARPVLRKLSDIELDGETALFFAFVIAEVDKHFYNYSKEEMKVIQKHCEKDENDVPIRDETIGNFKLLSGHAMDANKELSELSNTVIDYNNNFLIDINCLKKIKLTPSDADALKKFIEI